DRVVHHRQGECRAKPFLLGTGVPITVGIEGEAVRLTAEGHVTRVCAGEVEDHAEDRRCHRICSEEI
ncbi:hypothetical protein GN956_G27217, partial [Arapaima gigas]